jgi:hypothetical protein
MVIETPASTAAASTRSPPIRLIFIRPPELPELQS